MKEILKTIPPQLITFEGIDGSGKSTQVNMLYNFLIDNDIKVISTDGMFSANIGNQIKNIIMDHTLHNTSELLLILATRYEHFYNFILPFLEKGYWVICDRFIDSTFAYQSRDGKMSIDAIYELHCKLFEDNRLIPNLTFYIDIDVHKAIERINIRGNSNKFDIMTVQKFNTIKDNYSLVCKKFSDRIQIVKDYGADISKMHECILNKFAQHYNL